MSALSARSGGALLLTATLLLAPAAWAQHYDVLIRGGTVYDGTDTPGRVTDVAINGERIVRIGPVEAGAKATLDIDATGKIVSPGFIDPHSHAADGLLTSELAPALPQLYQGVTTLFTNPDGGGPGDLTDQLARTRALVPGANVAPMIGHNGVRKAVMGDVDRLPTAAEQQQMEALVKKAMDGGAFGFSTGLQYIPGKFSETSEVVGLAKVAARYPGAFYISHMRDESAGVLQSLDELVTVARQAKLTSIATHLKPLGKVVWGLSARMIAAIEKARAEGLPVWADQYPYEANGGALQSMFVPGWAQAGGSTELVARLAKPALRARIRTAMIQAIDEFGGAPRVQIRNYKADPSLNGKRLADIAKANGLEPVDMAIAMIEKGGASTVIFSLDGADVEAIMKQPWTMTGSDGALVPFGGSAEHPRAYGTYPRKIRSYVLDKPVITMQQAIHAATGLPAQVLSLPERGFLRAGYFADVIVFDPATIRDLATYTQPHAYSVGVEHVFVNGHTALTGGKATPERWGRVLSRNTETR
jgi:N-acyl-D-amino-acid deacylase